jgi:hypothetical protein
VQAEGGYGDLFMNMRWLPKLRSWQGIARVGMTVLSQSVANMLDWSIMGVDDVYVVNKDKLPFGRYQCAVSALSLPYIFGVKGWEEIPLHTVTMEGKPLWRYFAADESPGDDPRIGFCWRAEENTSPIRTKSLETEDAEAAVAAIRSAYPKAVIRSLSPEKADIYSTDVFTLPPSLEVEPERMKDWNATAGYLCDFDYILTVDTAIAHLAGVLEIPTMALIPRSSCWRWGTPTDPCHWYKSVQLYRQPDAKWNVPDICRTFLSMVKGARHA